MNIMKLPFYLGIFAALVGIVILKFELPKLYHFIMDMTSDKDHYHVWLSSKDSSRLNLERNVFKYLKYNEIDGLYNEKWDLLWTVEYPYYRHKDAIKNLRQHQRINHFPGMASLTIKKHLATKFIKYDFIPKGFTFPSMMNDFEKFIVDNPDKRFVEKNWNNRGVRLVRNVKEMNFQSLSMKEKFLQEFIGNPYLIDNRMFDIGIYVLVTSFDPLRVYKFNKEILLRFCAEHYHPFDEDNTKKFVVDDNSIYVWDLPSLRDYVLKFNYTSKEAFEIYMSRKGFDISEMWVKMDDAIVRLLLDNEKNVINESQNFGQSTRNFFEILRFDFILDDNLNIHLMEINMSPNLGAIKDVSNIKKNYRSQLVYDTLNLIGVTGVKHQHGESFIVSDQRDVTIPSTECDAITCINCLHEECMMCVGCMEYIHQSYGEHVRRGRMKRIFPIQKHYRDENLISHVSASNKFSIQWFKEKCIRDSEWC